MQHPKTRGGSTRSTGKPKIFGANRDNGSSQNLGTRSQRVPISEKKRVSELETQVAELEEELVNTKDQLSEAHREADEVKMQLTATIAKLDELWACEESRIHELRKISQDRDRAWESELKAVQKHLTFAINENQKLNNRLAESEAAHDEIEKLKIQLNESKDSEGTALAATADLESELRRLKVQMEQCKKAAELAAAMVLGDGVKFGESFDIHVIGESLNSPAHSEDESLNKKTSNMLKKLGVLLKKSHK